MMKNVNTLATYGIKYLKKIQKLKKVMKELFFLSQKEPKQFENYMTFLLISAFGEHFKPQ